MTTAVSDLKLFYDASYSFEVTSSTDGPKLFWAGLLPVEWAWKTITKPKYAMTKCIQTQQGRRVCVFSLAFSHPNASSSMGTSFVSGKGMKKRGYIRRGGGYDSFLLCLSPKNDNKGLSTGNGV